MHRRHRFERPHSIAAAARQHSRRCTTIKLQKGYGFRRLSSIARLVHLALAWYIDPNLEAFQNGTSAASFSVLYSAANAVQESPEGAVQCMIGYLIHCIPGLSNVLRLPRESAWRPWPCTMYVRMSMPRWGCHPTGNSSSSAEGDRIPCEGPCEKSCEHQLSEIRKQRGTGAVHAGSEYKVVTHQKRVGFFSGNRLWETLLHSKRFAAGWVRRHGGKALQNTHHLLAGSFVIRGYFFLSGKTFAGARCNASSPALQSLLSLM